MSTAILPMSAAVQPPQVASKGMGSLLENARHLEDLFRFGKLLVASGMIPSSISRPEAAVAIMLKGAELGIGAMHAFDSISVIQGKPTISPQLMLALIERSGLLEDLQVAEDKDSCSVTMKRRGRSPQTVRFDRAEAVAMKLAGKDNWLKQFGVMMYWRAITKACRRVFPDVIAGCYTPDEMGMEVTEDGDIIDGEVIEPAAPGSKHATNDSGFGRTGTYASPEQVTAFNAWIKEMHGVERPKWEDAWIEANREFPDGLAEFPIHSHQLINHLFKEAVALGKLARVAKTQDPNSGEVIDKVSVEEKRKMVAILHARDFGWLDVEGRSWYWQQAVRVAQAFALANPAINLPAIYEIEDEPDDPAEASQEAPDRGDAYEGDLD